MARNPWPPVVDSPRTRDTAASCDLAEGKNAHFGSNTNIVLCDGAPLTVNGAAIFLSTTSHGETLSLNIWGQTANTGKMTITGADVASSQACLGGSTSSANNSPVGINSGVIDIAAAHRLQPGHRQL